jgi:hypothetical protein
MNKQSILVNRRCPVPVEVPEWEGTVYLIPMSLTDLLYLEQTNRKDEAQQRADTTALMLVRYIADPAGKRIFEDADAPKLIETQPATILANLFARLAEISQPQPEQAEKNSVSSR